MISLTTGMIRMSLTAIVVPFIYIYHQHVSEHGHKRFRTGSYRQVHMAEPSLLLLVNYRQKDRYISL